MELWLKLTPGQAVLLEMIGELDVTYDLLREHFNDEDVLEMIEDAKVSRRGDWSVIQMGLPKSVQPDAN